MTNFYRDRSNSSTAMMTANVIAATVSRRDQLIPRLTHHSSAQLMMTGTTISSCKIASCLRR